MSLPDIAAYGIEHADLDTFLFQSNQSDLPQVPLLKKVLKTLTKDNLLEEAYLRGSFSFGQADVLSDTDLFVVVTPENLPKAHARFKEMLKQSGDILVGCHDKFVTDYGGIGFMYLTQDKAEGKPDSDRKIRQFDIYFALKGVPQKSNLCDTYRVYSKDPSYAWVTEWDSKVRMSEADMPEETTAFIKKMTASSAARKNPTPEEREGSVVSAFNDLVVGLFIMEKHLRRDDRPRAHNDDFQIINSLISMVRHHEGKASFQSDLYAFKAISRDITERKDSEKLQRHVLRIAEAMEDLPSTDKIANCFKLGVEMMRDFAPKHLEENYQQLAMLDQNVFKSGSIVHPCVMVAPVLVRPPRFARPTKG